MPDFNKILEDLTSAAEEARQNINDFADTAITRAKQIGGLIKEHRWRIYFVFLGIAVAVLCILGINEIKWARHHAMNRAVPPLEDAQFNPGAQPDSMAQGSINALRATLHAAYATAYFSLASILIGVSSLLYSVRQK